MKPTNEQKAIIAEERHCVVMAAPGSGKTFVVTEKIRGVMKEAALYRGVIAISFTNKASDELKQRTLAGQEKAHGSYFGTIDRFCFVEVLAPFGHNVFGHSIKEFEVVAKKDLGEELLKKLSDLPEIERPDKLSDEHIAFYKELYLEGIVLLEHIGICSLLIIASSHACRRYLQARFSHVFIDEYQDSSLEQHLLFMELVSLGLTGTAVGDVKQAIYGFAQKDQRHLRSLWDDADFQSYPLTINHRCHPSISNYAKKLFATVNTEFAPQYADTGEKRVFEKCVSGKEEELCAWLDKAIPRFMEKLNTQLPRKVGILVNGNKRGEWVEQLLKTPGRFHRTTVLDTEVSLWGALFKRTLTYLLDPSDTALAVTAEYIDIHVSTSTARQVISQLKVLHGVFKKIADPKELLDDGFRKSILDKFEVLAQRIYKGTSNKKALVVLDTLLQQPANLISFLPADDGKVQIMTIHKSKGLEFDIVFHLDLMDWILPRRVYVEGQWDPPVYDDLISCTNVHFVGLTRAKEACILVHMTRRRNKAGEVKSGKPSQFIRGEQFGDLCELRQVSPV
jgi:superfamily I DNA/RNA helicase